LTLEVGKNICSFAGCIGFMRIIIKINRERGKKEAKKEG
jgi:hypothetical protein